MKIDITAHIDAAKILRERGLGASDDVRRVIASEVVRLADPYVPMSSGSGAHMKSKVQIAQDGRTVTYPGPYAHYQYHGVVMAGRAPRHYTGRLIDYHNDTGLRGKEWDKRMMVDRGDEIIEAAAHRAGGKPKK